MTGSSWIALWPMGFVAFWLAGLAAILAARLLSGRISLRGILGDAADGPVAPERLAPVAVTALVLGQWVGGIAAHAPSPQASLPDIPMTFLGLLAASQAAYLGGKGFRRFKRGRRP